MKKAEVLKLLEKKAKGFFYSETTEEFVVDGGKDLEASRTQNVKKEATKSGFSDKNSENSEELTENKIDEKNSLKNDAVLHKSENTMLECKGKPRGRPRKLPPPRMVLAKKKTTTYYVPPDMTAIKILLDLQGVEQKEPIEDVAKRREELLNEIVELVRGEERMN